MGIRVDKYLFAMRIYKTRAIAADACKVGRVTINGRPLKASNSLEIGNKFSVRKGPITFTYEILQLSENRLGAKLVPDYLRDITSKDQLELIEMAKLAGQSGRDRGTGRPTKKDRREIMDFMQEDYSQDLDDIDDEE